MLRKQTVASLCEDTTSKLRKIVEVQNKKVEKDLAVIQKKQVKVEAANNEVKAAESAIKGFEKLFGIEG